MSHDSDNVLESRLRRASHLEIKEEFAILESGVLAKLLDSRSTKVGDAAAYELARRCETALVIEAVASDTIRKAVGRVRALYVLGMFGASCPEALRAYMHCLDDRSDDVLGDALFGIVFLRRDDLLPEIRQRLDSAMDGTERADMLRKAVDALEANDPAIYSPYYADPRGIWSV